MAAARLSSTVVLVRDSDRQPEVFMVRRHAKSSFGEAYAFPGGVLEHDDHLVHDYCAGLGQGAADELLGTDSALDFYSSAVRELFEETGVLLADFPSPGPQLDDARRRLNDGSLVWHEFVVQEQLRLRCDELLYFSYWVTPAPLPKRYATRFFVAEMPAGQAASHCGGELTDSVWITPADALAASKKGEMELHFPTLSTIRNLEGKNCVNDIKSWCAGIQRAGIPRIQPVIIDGRPVIR